MHSIFSPSAAHRWLKCSASLQYSGEPSPPSKYTLEGSKAHEICEHLVKRGKPFELGKEIGTSHGKIMYDETLHEAAMMYCEFVWAKEEEFGIKAQIEKKINLTDRCFGTPDAIIAADFLGLCVVDFKYGAGEIVDPYQNPQLSIYAAAVLQNMGFPPEKIQMVIIQPRSREDQKIKIWETTPDKIERTIPSILQTQEAYDRNELIYLQGPHCKWCPGSTKCPEVTQTIELALKESNDLETIGRILRAEASILDRLNQLKQQAHAALLAGEQVPGFKLVEAIGNRRWIDPDKVKRKYGLRKACEYTLLSPNELKQKLGKSEHEWIEANCERPSNGLKLVPESDKRPAYNQKLFEEV
jgi:hypothetical protein